MKKIDLPGIDFEGSRCMTNQAREAVDWSDIGYAIVCVIKEQSTIRCFIFLSSRRRHTRSDRDWSSDVCSSDLLDQVDRVGPDIIVLDLNMPGLDGYGVLSHLRSRPATADIPVIVLTAKSDEDNEVRVFELGADDFLTKPFRARALSARLEAVLGRRR